MSKHTPKNRPKGQREDSILEHGLDLMKFARKKPRLRFLVGRFSTQFSPQFDRAASKMGEEQRHEGRTVSHSNQGIIW